MRVETKAGSSTPADLALLPVPLLAFFACVSLKYIPPGDDGNPFRESAYRDGWGPAVPSELGSGKAATVYGRMYGRMPSTHDCEAIFRSTQGNSAEASLPCVYSTLSKC
jgi:hypothetical protein